MLPEESNDKCEFNCHKITVAKYKQISFFTSIQNTNSLLLHTSCPKATYEKVG
jgi:hypothetical protein